VLYLPQNSKSAIYVADICKDDAPEVFA